MVLRNCEITFISISYDCLYPKATYCALSSTVHPDLCISYGISDVDLTYNYISIVMHVCHHMILHIAIDFIMSYKYLMYIILYINWSVSHLFCKGLIQWSERFKTMKHRRLSLVRRTACVKVRCKCFEAQLPKVYYASYVAVRCQCSPACAASVGVRC